jgi:hypothetical protein
VGSHCQRRPSTSSTRGETRIWLWLMLSIGPLLYLLVSNQNRVLKVLMEELNCHQRLDRRFQSPVCFFAYFIDLKVMAWQQVVVLEVPSYKRIRFSS